MDCIVIIFNRLVQSECGATWQQNPRGAQLDGNTRVYCALYTVTACNNPAAGTMHACALCSIAPYTCMPA
jgi:hypothetical protein